jgi:nicotinamidase-related amidase
MPQTTTIDAEPYPLFFDTATMALLLIDMQRDFLEPGGFGEVLGNDVSLLRKTIKPCQSVLKEARNASITVIHTREGHRSDLADAPPSKLARGNLKTGIGDKGPMGRILIRGEIGHDIIPELAPEEGEPVIDKPGKGAFYETDLHLILQNRNIKTLIVCGVTTDECVVLEDCVGSYFPEFQCVAIEMIKAQGGILGWVSNSASAISAINTYSKQIFQ